MSAKIEKLYKPREIQELLGVSRATAYRLIDEAGPYHGVGGKRIAESRLRAYLDANTAKSLHQLRSEL